MRMSRMILGFLAVAQHQEDQNSTQTTLHVFEMKFEMKLR
jgi:hypothetical protein